MPKPTKNSNEEEKKQEFEEIEYNFGDKNGGGQNFESVLGIRDSESKGKVKKVFDKEDRETVMLRMTTHAEEKLSDL